MTTQRHRRKTNFFMQVLYTLISVLLVLSIFSITLGSTVSANRGFPLSSCCEGGDCCILSDCVCPNCEDRGEPGSVCLTCGGDLCANCGNCYDCGLSPCPVCRDYCFVCESVNLCGTCNGCLDCGHNRDPECPGCGEELLPVEDTDIDNYYDAFSEPVTEAEISPLFSIAGFDFFLFAPFGMPAWAVLNLLLTIAGIVFSSIIIMRAARQKELDSNEFYELTAKLYSVNSLENIKLLSALENEERYVQQRRLLALLITCFLSFIAVVLLALMQDFKGIIVLFDWWVIIHSVIFAGVLIFGRLVFYKYETSYNPQYVPST